MTGPVVVQRCPSCRHPAHAGRPRCGVRTFFTGTCGCDMGAPVDFDERRAQREPDDAEWWPDPRD